MKIALYFGSFNPIHHGHLIIASTILDQYYFDKLWFVISPRNPLKTQSSLLSEYHRKYLVDLAIEGEKRLKSSTVEFNLPKPSYTIDTMTYLEEQYPNDTFTIIIGSDSYMNIKQWKNSEILLKKYPVIIYSRPGYEISGDIPSTVSILKTPLIEISSTGIREMIKKKKSIKFFVPDLVKEEIDRNHYYS